MKLVINRTSFLEAYGDLFNVGSDSKLEEIDIKSDATFGVHRHFELVGKRLEKSFRIIECEHAEKT